MATCFARFIKVSRALSFSGKRQKAHHCLCVVATIGKAQRNLYLPALPIIATFCGRQRFALHTPEKAALSAGGTCASNLTEAQPALFQRKSAPRAAIPFTPPPSITTSINPTRSPSPLPSGLCRVDRFAAAGLNSRLKSGYLASGIIGVKSWVVSMKGVLSVGLCRL